MTYEEPKGWQVMLKQIAAVIADVVIEACHGNPDAVIVILNFSIVVLNAVILALLFKFH